jgi:DUF971 family protein
MGGMDSYLRYTYWELGPDLDTHYGTDGVRRCCNVNEREGATAMTSEWPSEIRLNHARDVLNVTFENGEKVALPAEYLRVLSPSAEVQGHSAAERKVLGGKRHVLITAVEPVGNYAVRLIFSDGHSTGLFTWAYLLELGRDHEQLWARYVGELAAKGLSRD